eukprot:1579226-Amphidinium_carterae.2
MHSERCLNRNCSRVSAASSRSEEDGLDPLLFESLSESAATLCAISMTWILSSSTSITCLGTRRIGSGGGAIGWVATVRGFGMALCRAGAPSPGTGARDFTGTAGGTCGRGAARVG